MAKRRSMPSLRDTGRSYVEHTRRARLASPGVERYTRPPGAGRSIVLALAVAAVLVAAMLWLR